MRVVISGCSGGGKSTLLSLMESDGFQVYHEPGRQIVKDQLECGGSGLPWENAILFAELCIAKCMEFHGSADNADYPVIYDRSYIDALSALEAMNSANRSDYYGNESHYRYHNTVYFTPPWEEIYTTDEERRHSFTDSLVEYKRLVKSYTEYGYRIVEIPKTERNARFEFLKRAVLADWESYNNA